MQTRHIAALMRERGGHVDHSTVNRWVVTYSPPLAEAFHRAHAESYGFADRTREIELVAVRTVEARPAPEVEIVGRGHLAVEGPQVVALPGATAWVPPGWSGETDRHGTLILERRTDREP